MARRTEAAGALCRAGLAVDAPAAATLPVSPEAAVPRLPFLMDQEDSATANARISVGLVIAAQQRRPDPIRCSFADALVRLQVELLASAL